MPTRNDPAYSTPDSSPRESGGAGVPSWRLAAWIPAFAGMTNSSGLKRPFRGRLLASARCGRVFAGLLRCDVGIGAGRLLRRLLVHLQSRPPIPGALQLVLDVEGELPDAVDFELDLVAVHERVEAAMVGAGGDDVAGLQRVDRRQPLDAARDLVPHVVGVEVLHQGAVVPQPNLQFLRIADLVGSDDIGADRREGVARFH